MLRATNRYPVMPNDYIHGFSQQEQQRLIRQAEVLAPNVFDGWSLAPGERVLELGCGVGAELKILHERWPDTHFTGVDLNPSHLACARELLDPVIEAGAIDLVQADATDLPFQAGSFDCVITIWMLEHATAPDAVLSEARRVVRPGGRMIATEVDNDTFQFEPDVPSIAAWWDLFNRFQAEQGGYPCIGRDLDKRMHGAGFRNVTCTCFPNVSSRHEPERKETLLNYLEELLLSGDEQLRARGDIDDGMKRALIEAFGKARIRDNQHFRYMAYRVTGTA